MTHGGPVDLVRLSGRVAEAHRALGRALVSLATEDGRERARSIDPFEPVREVTGRSTFEALRKLDTSPFDAPHRDALLRWVHELLQARIGWDLVLDEADAVHAPDPTLAGRRARADAVTAGASPERASSPPPGDEPTPLVTFDAARRALIEAPHAAAADLAFARASELAAPVAAVRKELRARRFEAARRLSLDHPWALATSGGATPAVALAHAVLDATDALAIELRKDLQKRSGRAVTAARTIHDGFARGANEGWPARLGARWLEDVFRAIAPRPPRAVVIPHALGGASFLRAAAAWGAALRMGGVARSLPFALARDPYPASARVFGGALAAAVAGKVFARRKLGLPSRSADAQARALTRTLFAELRVAAAELVAGERPAARDDELEELTARVFGAPFPASLAAAWSFGGLGGRARIDAPARLAGAVRAYAFVQDLVARFDEDWFDNPRAGAHLASIAAGPVWDGDVPEPSSAQAVARAFEETLG